MAYRAVYSNYKLASIQKVTLVADTEAVINVGENNFCLIQNLGVGNCYIAFDRTADNTQWTLLDGDILPVSVGRLSIHLLSNSTPTIQVMELCTAGD